MGPWELAGSEQVNLSPWYRLLAYRASAANKQLRSGRARRQEWVRGSVQQVLPFTHSWHLSVKYRVLRVQGCLAESGASLEAATCPLRQETASRPTPDQVLIPPSKHALQQYSSTSSANCICRHTPNKMQFLSASSSLLLAAAGLFSAVSAHNIQLPAHGRECFHEQLRKDDKMTVSFQVGDREFGSAGNLEIDFWVRLLLCASPPCQTRQAG